MGFYSRGRPTVGESVIRGVLLEVGLLSASQSFVGFYSRGRPTVGESVIRGVLLQR